MQTIKITDEDVDALARTAMSEVGHFGKAFGADTLKGGVEAVIDTILNRVAHPGYPDSIGEVVDARWQFSAIGAPGGAKTWRRLPKASADVNAIVSQHLAERLAGKTSTVKGAQNFLNPHLSSAKALNSWGRHVVEHHVAVWGRGRDIHFHGYAPHTAPPPAYTLRMGNKSHPFTGEGRSASTGASTGEAGADGPIADRPDAEADAIVVIEPEADDTLAYRVEEVAQADAAALQAVLNQRSAEGWRLRQILPGWDKLVVVFEGADTDEFVHETDDRGEEDDRPAPVAPAVITDSSPEARFARFLGDMRLRHFDPHEFLVLGGQNGMKGRAQGKNSLPPEDLWRNIVPTARVLDELREALGARVRLSSVYRSPAYNAMLPGAATGSMHTQFRAADFSCDDGRGPVWWAKQLKRLRDSGAFEGGIGVYPTFVHVDTRGTNAKWGPWMSRVFG